MSVRVIKVQCIDMAIGTLYVEELRATMRGRFALIGAGVILLTVGCVATVGTQDTWLDGYGVIAYFLVPLAFIPLAAVALASQPDIAGSTARIAGLDAEAAMNFLHPIVMVMARAVNRYDGTVLRTLGDGLKAAFGVPHAREGHAVLACHAALGRLRLSPVQLIATMAPCSVRSPLACTVTMDPLMVMPDVLMAMLFAPTVSVIDCPAVIELDPADTLIEWLPVDTVRLSLPVDTVVELLPCLIVTELSLWIVTVFLPCETVNELSPLFSVIDRLPWSTVTVSLFFTSAV